MLPSLKQTSTSPFYEVATGQIPTYFISEKKDGSKRCFYYHLLTGLNIDNLGVLKIELVDQQIRVEGRNLNILFEEFSKQVVTIIREGHSGFDRFGTKEVFIRRLSET